MPLAARPAIEELVRLRYGLWRLHDAHPNLGELGLRLHALDDVASIVASLHLEPFFYPSILPELRQALRAQGVA